MARVELKGLRKEFPGGVIAVEGADLTFKDKEFVVLVGPSGCGKSTLLRMIAGLEEATAGEIYIGGRKVNDVQPKDRDIAMVFQNYALYPHMTVYKNMAFGLMLRKYKKAEIKQRVEEAAKILGIEDLMNRRPKALSGGQRQRVAVGRAIVRQPQVFLFDEPLSNLDAKLRVQMRAEISKLHDRLQTTMIYVTHDQVEAMTMGERIVVMLDGAIQQVATPLELYGRPTNLFVAGFIGSPAMNLIEGALSAENGEVRFRDGSGTLDLVVDVAHHSALEPSLGGKVVFGIRPEDLNDNPGQQLRPGAGFKTNVDVVEPMGAETYLYLSVGQGTFVARIPSGHFASGQTPAVNAPRVLDVSMAKAHYFDCTSEKRIV